MAETLETRVAAVVVYPDRARVTRSGTVKLEAGAQRVEISGLPSALEPASVRATARGSAQARLSSVEVRRYYLEEALEAGLRDLERKVEALEDQRRALEMRFNLEQGLRNAADGVLGSTEVYVRGMAFGKTATSDLLGLWDQVRERSTALDAAQQEMLVQRRELERTLTQLQSELAQRRVARGREAYLAAVEFLVVQPGELTIEVSYVLSGAGWQPLYDLRLEENEKTTVEASYLGQVTQKTGEAWEAVALTLSTARPSLSQGVPELTPWTINQRIPYQMQTAAMPKGGLMTRAAMPAPQAMFRDEEKSMKEDSDVADMPRSIEPVMAEVVTAGATVNYRVPGEVSIPSDGAPHKVNVARVQWNPTMDYITAPKIGETVYRRAKVRNDSLYTFLPGTANLFVGDEFLGNAPLEMLAPNGEAELAFGPDDRIKVERKLVRRDVDRKLLGARRIRYAYEIKLENYLPREAKVTVLDQIPVSRHESIKVRWESGDPAPVEQTDMGEVRWELTLAAQEKRTLRFEFSVEHPRDMDVTGLN